MILATLPVMWGEYALSGAMLTAVAVVMAALAFWRLGNPGLIRFMRMAQGLMLAYRWRVGCCWRRS